MRPGALNGRPGGHAQPVTLLAKEKSNKVKKRGKRRGTRCEILHPLHFQGLLQASWRIPVSTAGRDGLPPELNVSGSHSPLTMPDGWRKTYVRTGPRAGRRPGIAHQTSAPIACGGNSKSTGEAKTCPGPWERAGVISVRDAKKILAVACPKKLKRMAGAISTGILTVASGDKHSTL